MEFLKYGIVQSDIPDLTEQEIEAYKKRVETENGTLEDVTKIIVTDAGDGNVNVGYETASKSKFQRIARITGNRAEEARQAA